MKQSLAFFSFLLLLIVFPSLVEAQSATPSAEIRRLIRERIEQTIQEKNPETEKLLGTLGSVQKVSERTFTIVDTLGRERTIQLSDTTVMRFNNQPLALKDLSINAGAAIIGVMQDDIIINARRIYVTDGAFVERRQVNVGTITEWKNSELTLAIRGSDAVATWKTVRKPVFEDSLGNTITAKDIQADRAAIIVTEEDAAGNRLISRIRLLVPVTELKSPSPSPRVSPRP